MTVHKKNIFISTLLPLALSLAATSVSSPAEAAGKYKVTIQNWTQGQPLSPLVAATHRRGIRMFQVGDHASVELVAIAENGNQIPMFDLFSGSSLVTDLVDFGAPLTPSGSTAGGFSDAATFEIAAERGDRLSFATMLICTNDGFTGLNRAGLPSGGSVIRWVNGYDAGTENNTELSTDIVDPCSGIGPIGLPGDPNGNENDLVDTDPREPIMLHPNIAGAGDLTTADHGWEEPVAKVTITRISDTATRFRAPLGGAGEVPLVETVATGRADFALEGDELRFGLRATLLVRVVAAHIHAGPPNQNGPVVAFLFSGGPTGVVHGRFARGSITEADLVGPFAGNFAGFLAALRNGDLYVNVHTVDHGSGEIRGQIGAR